MTESTQRDIWCRGFWGNLTLCCGIIFLIGGLLIPAVSLAGGPIDPKGPGMLVAAIGMPSFLLGHVLGIIALASDNSHSKRNAKLGLVTIWISIVLGIVLVLVFRAR